MSMWLSTSPCSEQSEDGNFRVSWHQDCGFGFWVCEAWCKGTRISSHSSIEFEIARDKARQACQRHAAGVPA